MLRVNNIFFSIQGEGIDAGMPTIFIRFAGCPFRCPYCDEPQALSKTAGDDYSWESLFNKVIEICDKEKCYNIELTGGSPEAQNQMELFAFCSALKDKNKDIRLSIQLSGGIMLINRLWYIIDNHKIDYKEPITNIPFVIPLEYITERDEVKFVVDTDGKNWEWFLDKLGLFSNIKTNLIIAPKTVSQSDDLENAKILTEKILKYKDIANKSNLKIIPRLQQVYWPNIKGV